MSLSKREREALAKIKYLLPQDAMSLQMRLDITMGAARSCGWVVNMAIETGGDFERVTFSASRPRALTEPTAIQRSAETADADAEGGANPVSKGAQND